jgi:hypothetical protein
VRWLAYGSQNPISETGGGFCNTHAQAVSGTTHTQGTSAMAELGVGLQAGGWNASIGAPWVDGGAYGSVVGGQATLRFAW